MNRFISPPLSQLNSLRTPLTQGEKQVLEFFDRYLPQDWEIYVQPHLNGLRPDFVLLNPNVGIAVYEIKDWNLDARHYSMRSRTGLSPELWIEDRDGKQFKRRDNPIDKINEYKHAILDLYCPRLQIRAIDNPKLIAVVTAGVIMTGAKTTRVEELLEPSRRHFKMLSEPRYYPLVGSDVIENGDVSRVFPESTRSSSYLMNVQFADDLRSWLIEPDVAAVQRQPLVLDSRQRALVNGRTPTGYRRIKGPAGSGKSLILAARTAQLSVENRDVLVVTFNQTLWHYLRDLAVRYPVSGRRINDHVTWCHFHEWCKRVCIEAGVEEEYRSLWSKADAAADSIDDVLQHQLPRLVDRALTANRSQVTTYDALLVDEGQDFNLDWWNVLRKVIRQGGEYLLVADETQDLYDQTKYWTDEKMISAGFPGGQWTSLTTSYRLPPTLITLLRDFAGRYLPNSTINLPQEEQLPLTLYPVYLRWIQVSAACVAETCVEAINNLHTITKNVLAYPDITLLTQSHESGLECVKLLQMKGIRCAHVFGSTNHEKQNRKRAFYMGDSKVTASTIHSFKGWETKALVVQISSVTDQRALAAIYVGLSRLKRHEQESFLTVVCSAPELEEYGSTWSNFEKP